VSLQQQRRIVRLSSQTSVASHAPWLVAVVGPKASQRSDEPLPQASQVKLEKSDPPQLPAMHVSPSDAQRALQVSNAAEASIHGLQPGAHAPAVQQAPLHPSPWFLQARPHAPQFCQSLDVSPQVVPPPVPDWADPPELLPPFPPAPAGEPALPPSVPPPEPLPP
jgi:hypothetical protein